MSWNTLSYLGDSMLLLPTAVIIALVMPWKNNDRRAVWFWIVVFCLAGALVSLSKIAFMGFGIGSARFNFTGFSGHSAMSATLWPVMFWLLSGRLSALLRGAALAVGYLIPLMVGFSRLELDVHSTSEVVSGLLLGYTLSSAFLLSQRSSQLKGFSVVQLCVALLVPVLLFSHGRVATTQGFLTHLSTKITGLEKPFTRSELLQQP
ncbi:MULTISPECIES: phosphatase PAP2 family protein [Winslowiella]|uniref:phosphatase PAP2 family protein n=1 Tax=Winslowiella TaxID=2997349 RepID=UPI0028BEF17B|nr:phosphatase PAP2 family protein [Winslowiella toletana]WNN42987.1 phosphatase PAP2 family protein [Winslowiella toletana]